MNRFFHTIIIFSGVIIPLAVTAQLPTITTKVDKNKILIGEQITYDVHAQMPDNTYRLTWFTMPETFGSFVVAHTGKIDSTFANGLLGFTQKMIITSFDSGRQVIPPLKFQFETLSGDSTFLMYSDSIPIDVTYSPADSVLPFHDIKSILKVKKETTSWLWPAIIAGILLLIILLYLYLRKKKKKKPVEIFDNTLPPYDEAMKGLYELQQKHLPEKGNFNFYFTDLSDIFKKYLSRKNNINLMSLTGTELIAKVKDKTDRESLSRFASCIIMGEAAKFAKYQPSVTESNNCLDEIRKLINQLNTPPKEPENDL